MSAMTLLTYGVQGVEAAVCLAVCAVLLPRWRRHRGQAATAAALGLFAVLALVVVSSWVTPADPRAGWGLAWTKAVTLVLLGVPCLLVALARGLSATSRRTHRVLLALYALEAVVTVATPAVPPAGTPRPAWVSAYVLLVVVAWSAQSVAAAVALWRAGRSTSSVVRHRMRTLATGGVVLAVALVGIGAAGSSPSDATQVVLLLVGLASVLLLALAFLLPTSLRVVWRQDDVAALAEAERGLMTAVTAAEVADTLVPVLGKALGGGAALLDSRGTPLRSELPSADVEALLPLLRALPSPRQCTPVPGVVAAPVAGGWLLVQAGRLSPLFGDDEAALIGRVATLVDLALQRVRLFEQETSSRRAAQTAQAEVETLLYSVSHDLRSPLISVLGYLEVLRSEHGAALEGDAGHYLDRVAVNAQYMQSLIADLLELSRIGRTDPPSEVVDLAGLVDEVLDGARLAAPGAHLSRDGELPAVVATDVRLRQLVTNLVDNALKHGGRPDLAVTVGSATEDDGGFVLSVADDGGGIPAEYRTRVLRVFERLDARRTSGTGMGLAICKRIAESLGGTLEVAGPSRGAATGTTVRVLLPATVVVARPRATRPDAVRSDLPAPRQPAAATPVPTLTTTPEPR